MATIRRPISTVISSVHWPAVSAIGTLLGGIAGVALFVAGILPNSSGPQPVGREVDDLVRATVQISARDGKELAQQGSGSVISADGLILTAAHLLHDRHKPYGRIEIDTTEHVEEVPTAKYVAKIAANGSAIDYELDLAVLEVVSDLDGSKISRAELDLDFVETGDSNSVDILESIRILGYPSIGGDKLTATTGTVSGFTRQPGIGADRAWMMTDATIAGGSSGGMVVNEAGHLIAVPLQVGSGSDDTDAVECRSGLADTNEDGVIDASDTCVTVGGFINSVRPINLADELIDKAKTDAHYKPDPPTPTPDPTLPLFQDMVFSSDVTADGSPSETSDVLPLESTQLCAFWKYEGMTDGMVWDALWYKDGEVSEELSRVDQTWSGGVSDINWHHCVPSPVLSDGVYELELLVEGAFMLAGSVVVGADRPAQRLSLVNSSAVTICNVLASPVGAIYYGEDDLEDGQTIKPGEKLDVRVPSAKINLLVQDCDFNDLAEEADLDVREPFVVKPNER